jgi:DNA-binding HxlR family transcriptional regulator
VRDIVFYGKHTFGEFLASAERITTSVLSDRLASLVRDDILTKSKRDDDHRKEDYSLTEKGLALTPILVELANWGVTYGHDVTANTAWTSAARNDPTALNRLIRETVKAGGAVWQGPRSVIDQLSAST